VKLQEFRDRISQIPDNPEIWISWAGEDSEPVGNVNIRQVDGTAVLIVLSGLDAKEGENRRQGPEDHPTDP